MNYIGSKYSLLDFIHRTISDVTDSDPVMIIFLPIYSPEAVLSEQGIEKKAAELFQMIFNIIAM